MQNVRYYFQILSEKERQVYRAIYEALKKHERQISIGSGISGSRAAEIYYDVLNDEPLFFYVDQTTFRLGGLPGFYRIIPEYTYTSEQSARLLKEIIDFTDKICTRAEPYRDNEFMLERYIHDSTVKSVAYDYEGAMKANNPASHTIVGAFLERRAVCDGISRAFKLLCDRFNIKCLVAAGESMDMHTSGSGQHAWNVVKIRNQSYHVDATWDHLAVNGKSYVKYDYFNMTTEEISKTHKPNRKLPFCSSHDLNYFYYTNSLVKNYEQLRQLIKQRSSKPSIMFRVLTDSGEFLSKDEIYEKVNHAINYDASFLGKNFYVSVNETYGIVTILIL